MTWNHRVVRTNDSEEYLELAEVFYDSDDLPYAYGNATVGGDTLEELQVQLFWMMESLSKPILDYPEDFKGNINK
jgi:hypothetical protein